MKHARFSSLLVCAAALTFATALPAAAQEEGEAVKSILGSMGIIPKDPPRIDYRERAPLVVPPQLNLPPPADPNAVEAHASWPRDPDVVAARREAEEAAKPYPLTEAYRMDRNPRLSPEEMRAFGRLPAGRSAYPEVKPKDKATLDPDEMRALGQQVQRSSEPLKRRYLTDPPADMLRPAAGAPLKATADPGDTDRDRWLRR
jgi:hypothetical protein